MAVYTYLAYDLRSGQPIAELPLSGVTYTTVLNDDGTLSANIAPGNALGRDDLKAVLPGRTIIYVDRDGALQGPGWIYWDDDPSPSKVDIPESGCRGTLSYFDHRRILTTLVYVQVDQLVLAGDIIKSLQQVDGGNIGVLVPDLTCGVRRDRTYAASEVRNAREAIQQLAAVIDGFDFRFEARYGTSGAPEVVFNRGYPYLGRSVSDSGLVLEYPGNLLDYRFSRSGSSIATRVDAIGAGTDDDALRTYATNQALLDAGWPVLETDVSFSDVSVLTTLEEHALAEALARRGIVVTPEVTLLGDDPPVESYEVGDWVRLRLTDAVFYGDLLAADVDAQARIVQKSVTPPDDSGIEKVKLTLSTVAIPL